MENRWNCVLFAWQKKKHKILLACQTVAAVQIAPKICQGQNVLLEMNFWQNAIRIRSYFFKLEAVLCRHCGAVMPLGRYRSLGVEGSRTAMSTFYLQLDLMTFFDLYHSGSHERASSVSAWIFFVVVRDWGRLHISNICRDVWPYFVVQCTVPTVTSLCLLSIFCLFTCTLYKMVQKKLSHRLLHDKKMTLYSSLKLHHVPTDSSSSFIVRLCSKFVRKSLLKIPPAFL